MLSVYLGRTAILPLGREGGRKGGGEGKREERKKRMRNVDRGREERTEGERKSTSTYLAVQHPGPPPTKNDAQEIEQVVNTREEGREGREKKKTELVHLPFCV